MKATTSGNFKPTKLPEPQTTVARCYSMIDIGVVPNIYEGKVQGVVHRIFITWELPKFKAVFNEDKGMQPFVISEEFTLSTKDNSNLAKLVAAWRNRPFNIEEQKGWDPTIMIGKTAVIQFTHKRKKKFAEEDITGDKITNENTNMKIAAIMKRSKDMEMPGPINPYFVWDWDKVVAEGFKKEEWDKIPNFLKDKIKQSEEFQKLAPSDLGGNATAAANTTTAPVADAGPVTEDEW